MIVVIVSFASSSSSLPLKHTPKRVRILAVAATSRTHKLLLLHGRDAMSRSVGVLLAFSLLLALAFAHRPKQQIEQIAFIVVNFLLHTFFL